MNGLDLTIAIIAVLFLILGYAVLWFSFEEKTWFAVPIGSLCLAFGLILLYSQFLA